MPDPDIVNDRDAIGGRSVRTQLAVYTLSLVAPLLLFLGFLLWQIAANERGGLQAEAADLTRVIATALDREVAALSAALDVLSLSAPLQAGDFATFRRQADELKERQDLVVVLYDRSGQQLVNTRLPPEASLPRSATFPSWGEEALSRGRPFLTNLIVGRVSGTARFGVVTAVKVAGEPRYFLLLSLELARLQALLAQSSIPRGYSAFVVDRQGVVMARNVNPAEVVGRRASEDFLQNTGGRQGFWFGRAATTGRDVFIAYARSSLSDYRIGASISQAELNAPLWRSLGLFAVFGTIVAALSTALAWLFGRRITRPIVNLARLATALGRGDEVKAPATRFLEANQVGAELARASANLREREAELRDANEEIQRFAYIVSHDLRSPLVNIMGFTTELEALRGDLFGRLQELRDSAQDAARAKDDELGRDFDEAIGFIKASIDKMDRLIGAILQLSREGRREFNPERVDMEALLRSIEASLAHQAEQAEATITVGRLPHVISDRLALEQVFSNLVDNALKYLRRGVPGRIEITGRVSSGSAVYAVRDNGRGIDARDRDRVFDLFRRSGVQDRPGEGIGLAHVRALVRRLGGSITLTSEPGQGSTFTVTLPRRWAGERQRKAA